MAYTPTEWKTGDVITAEKLNNMESGIGDGQNNVEFVKLATLNLSASAETPTAGTGGLLQDNKSLGDLIGNKTIIGLTSMYRYDGTGGNEDYSNKKIPVNTYLNYMGYPIGLWNLPSHMADTSINVAVDWGYLFAANSGVTNYHGELDVYAICI